MNNSCLSHFDAATYATYEEWKSRLSKSPVRIQWDPERNVYANPLYQRSIQIGLTGIAVDLYVNEWILSINNITEKCLRLKGMIDANNPEYKALLPIEKVYALDFETANVIGGST